MKNFMIVGTQRTGSSVIGESLGLHPESTCGWEWTQRGSRGGKFKIAERALAGDFSALSQADQEHMARVHNAGKTYLGFRRLFRSSHWWLLHPSLSPALFMDRLEGHLRWLRSHPDIYIIHIVRSNNVDWLKSKFLASQSDLFFGKKYPDGMKVTIPVREAIMRLRAKNWVDARLASLKNSNPYLRLSYEDFLADKDKVTAAALVFLQCDPTAAPVGEAKLMRQSKGQATDYVSNYQELQTELEKRKLLTAQF